MLIPSIDLMNGRVVQLVQGEQLAFETEDVQAWIDKFSAYPVVQLIDLDAAMGRGNNNTLVRRICAALPCQVGGGIRTVDAARRRLDDGARRVIVGSALFDTVGVRIDQAAAFEAAIGHEPFIAAVDSRGGQIVIHGWKTVVPIRAVDAVRALSPYAGAFLATLVDGEGKLGGLDRRAARELRTATDRQLIAAGGIRDLDEVAALDAEGIDAVVGMAIYTGRIK